MYIFCNIFQFSPIIDFYPEDFKIDLNGKKFAWQGVALLPFVDEARLHSALESVYKELTIAEGAYFELHPNMPEVVKLILKIWLGRGQCCQVLELRSPYSAL